MAWPITGEDVRRELKWTGNEGQAAMLEEHAAAAVSRIEAEIGPRSGQEIVATGYGPAATILLESAAAALASVTVAGVEVPVDRFLFDAGAGIVSGPFGPGPIEVRATAPDGVPPDVEIAAKFLAATWVKQSQVGPPSRGSRGTETDQDVLMGFAMPRRVSELIRPYKTDWGFS